MAVSATATFFLWKRASNSEDLDIDFLPGASPIQKHDEHDTTVSHFCEVAGGAEKEETKRSLTGEKLERKGEQAQQLDDLLDTALNDFMEKAPSTSVKNDEEGKEGTLSVSPHLDWLESSLFSGGKQEVILFKYGLHLQVPAQWDVVEGPTSAPNAAAIQIVPPETGAPGSAGGPAFMITIGIEDIGHPGLPEEEVIELLKATSMNTLYIMTNGVEPVLQKDEPVSVGPFSHMFQIMIVSPIMAICSTSFIALEGGMAYALQMIGNPNSQESGILKEVAKNITLMPISCKLGYLEVCLKDISLCVSPLWSLKQDPSSTAGTPLGAFEIKSKIASEDVVLYRLGDEPEEFQRLELKGSTDGVEIACSEQKNKKRFSFNNFVMCLTASDGVSRFPESMVLDALKSIQPFENGVNETSVDFVKDSHYRFKVRQGGTVLESKLSRDTVVYFPKGVLTDPQQDVLSFPTVIIRIDLEGECETLEEWRAKSEDSDPEAVFREEEICGERCLIVESKSMEETGMNERTEVCSRSLIFMVNSTSYLIRWELATGAWRRYEQEYEKFIVGFRFMK